MIMIYLEDNNNNILNDNLLNKLIINQIFTLILIKIIKK